MQNEKDAFYVVRKGDIVGVYKSLTDCQAQLASSVYDSSVSVFKGYGLSKLAEEHLNSRGLKNAICSIGASDVQPDLFGQLVPCPFQEPASSQKNVARTNPFEKKVQDVNIAGSTSFSLAPQRTQVKFENFIEAAPVSSYCCSCTLEFDGASKGNPGPAGAGAILRAVDGSQVYRLREGLGVVTNNVAEYRGVILGMKYALDKGFKHIRVQGDSKLVCMQVQGLWKIKNQNMGELCKVAKELKDKFVSFHISHIDRELNSEADAQANFGVHLQNGEVKVECDK
jgi:ribonuclease HI